MREINCVERYRLKKVEDFSHPVSVITMCEADNPEVFQIIPGKMCDESSRRRPCKDERTPSRSEPSRTNFLMVTVEIRISSFLRRGKRQRKCSRTLGRVRVLMTKDLTRRTCGIINASAPPIALQLMLSGPVLFGVQCKNKRFFIAVDQD